MKVGDYVMYIGWNPDYNGKRGTIDRLNDSSALIKFDQIIDKSRYAWWPIEQLKKIYTFDDLKFEEHPDFKSPEYNEFLKKQGRRKPDNLAEVANMIFDNGYSISVLFGVAFYSNGKDTYEIMCLDPNGNVLFRNEWGDEVLGNITSDEVTKWMIKLQTMEYQKRVFTAEDPYGEEEWDVNEGILAGINAKDVKVGDIVIYDPDLKPEKPHQVGCEASVVDINDKGVCKISFLDDNDTHYCHCDYLRWTGKRITDRRFTAEDPYGEEEWETNESAKVIKILYLDTLFDKYRLHINKLDLIAKELKKEVGNRVKPYAYFGEDRGNVKDIFDYWGYRILKDVSVKNNLVIYLTLEGVGDLIAADTLILHIKERVTSDADPYGEEEWEDTNEMRRGKFTPSDHVIREINTIGVLQDIVINYGRQHGEAPFGEQAWNEFADYLKRRLIGKVCSFPVLGKNSKGDPEVHGAGHWTIDDIYLDDNFKVHFVGHGRNSDEKHDVILHIGKSVTDVIYYEDKMITSPEDPYGEEEWELESVHESKKSKKRAVSRIRMAEIDPYGEEDWGWDVKINDENFKGKIIIFKKGYSDGYEYYFGVLTSHHDIYASHGVSQDLNRIKKYNKLIPLTEREIERIKRDRIEMVPYMIGSMKYKNPYGNTERVSYSKLGRETLFLDQEYMDNYLYMNENKVYESAKNLRVGDRVMYSLYNCEGTVVWKADDYSNEYMVEFDTPQPFAHNGKRGNAYEYGEFDPGYNDNRYYYVYGNTLDLIEGKTQGKVRWYRKGKLHNESLKISDNKIKESEIRKMLSGKRGDILNFFNTNFTGWIKFDNTDDLLKVNRWELSGYDPKYRSIIGYYDEYYVDGKVYDVSSALHYNNYPNHKYMNDNTLIKLETDSKLTNDDPYGEEDWDVDDFTIQESKVITSFHAFHNL